jgi:single-strand DNA-binding protein
MSKSVNKVILLGNIGKDPETRFLSSGTAVSTCSIATSHNFKNGDGEWTEKTEWTNLKFWGRLAEVVNEYVKKGDKLHVIGRLETQSWDDKESGEKKYRTEVVVEEMSLLGGKGEDGGSETKSKGNNRQSKKRQEPEDDDGVPF